MGAGVVGCPNVNAVFGGSGVAGAGGTPKPAKGVTGCGATGVVPNRGALSLETSPVEGLLPAFAGSAALTGVPKANGVDEAAGSVALVGVPNENGVVAVVAGSAGFTGAPKEKGTALDDIGLSVG